MYHCLMIINSFANLYAPKLDKTGFWEKHSLNMERSLLLLNMLTASPIFKHLHVAAWIST